MLNETAQNFISQSRAIHGANFSYEKLVAFNHTREKLNLVCNMCGNDYITTPHNHLIVKSNCPSCKRIKIKREADKKLISQLDFNSSKYEYIDTNINSSNNRKIIIKCKEHDEIFEQNIYGHLSGMNGCPICKHLNIQSLRMDKVKLYSEIYIEYGKKEGILYTLHFKHKFSNLEFIKIGITGRSIKERFQYGYSDFNYEIINEEHMTNLETAIKERELSIKFLKFRKQLPDNIKNNFDGYSECYSMEILDAENHNRAKNGY